MALTIYRSDNYHVTRDGIGVEITNLTNNPMYNHTVYLQGDDALAIRGELIDIAAIWFCPTDDSGNAVPTAAAADAKYREFADHCLSQYFTDEADPAMAPNDRLVATTRTHATNQQVTHDIHRLTASPDPEPAELHDASALAIASWWQSPGTEGRAFAQLASIGTVDLQHLLDDIHQARHYALDAALARELDLLATWAINHPSRTEH